MFTGGIRGIMLDILVGFFLIIVTVVGILAGITSALFILYVAYHIGQDLADIWGDIWR